MRPRFQIGILFIASSAFGCAAAVSDDGTRKGTPQPSATSGWDPYNVTPPGSAVGSASGNSGKAGAANGLAGSGGHGAVGGMSAGLGVAGGVASTEPNASGMSGMSGMNVGGVAGAGSGGSMPVPGGNPDCPSPTRARLPGGACVDRIAEFAVATRPTGIAAGSDGRVWFDDGSVNQVVQLETDGRVVARCSVPAGSVEREVVAGRGDVLIWYTDPSEKVLWNRTTADVANRIELGFAPRGLAIATDGAVWLSEANRTVYRLDLASLALTGWPATPSAVIVVGPDGNLWFPSQPGVIGRITSSGEQQDYSIGDSVADDLASGADGAVWFTDRSHDRIGRLELAGAPAKTYALPPNSGPRRIISGPDGALWFTESGSNAIGRITLGGYVSHYPVPSKDGVPWALTVGPDQKLWFTEHASGRIGRLTLDSAE